MLELSGWMQDFLQALEQHDGDAAERLTVLHIENAKKCVVSATVVAGNGKETKSWD